MTTQETIAGFVSSLAIAGRARDLDPDSPLIDAGLIDSMGMLELLDWLEQQFGVQIRDEEVLPDNFATVSTIARFVDEKLETGSEGTR
jgi:acyl carrier protein